MKSTQGLTLLEALILLVVLGILLALLFPAVGSGDHAYRAQAKNDVTQIATAVNAFETEYGHLPGTNRGDLGGKVLAALMGNNTNLNPRGLVFIEVNYVTKKGRSGLTNGYFVDPWGARYQIAFADGTNYYVTNAGAGTNTTTVKKTRRRLEQPRPRISGWQTTEGTPLRRLVGLISRPQKPLQFP
ncbi:hypothetical protein BH09VER1_BH09VER1_50510 [soil metagenome]